MPYIVTGEHSYAQPSFKEENHDYSYPGNLDLKPGSDFHNFLRSAIWERAIESRNEMSKRFPSWRQMDRTLTAYMPLKQHEEQLKSSDPSKPVSIVFPYTYSMLEALLTYLSGAFFQDPIFQYEGVEDDDTIGAMLMELLVRIHCIKNKVFLNIHTVLRDSLVYGIGCGVPGWRKHYGKRLVKSKTSTFEGTEKSAHFVESLLFEGNELTNIDPYMFLPDPNVSAGDIQRAEYVGWQEQDNLMNLLTEESSHNSNLFNVKYLKTHQRKRSSLSFDEDDRDIRTGKSSPFNSATSPVDIIKMYINLIPKDWDLGDSEYPEKWYFELANDDIIIACEPASHNHGMYPIATAAPEYDGYSSTPLSRMEVLHGLQHTLDFLFNSHVANVRKAVNDMLIVDPHLVNIKDLEDPQPGKLVRLRKPAWGRGVDKVVQQLQVNDITRMNISDSAYITQWMDRISGADQSMQGALRSSGPERLTKAEYSGTRSSAVSRLQRMAMVIGAQFMQDIGEMFAVHTQQFMSQDTSLRILGRHTEQLTSAFNNKKITVSPYDIAVNYDLIPRDGSVPGGNFSEIWVDLFKNISSNPELMQKFDVTRIFTYIAQQMGAKNVEDFKRPPQPQAQTLPDEQVEKEAQKGNLVPVEEM